MSNAEGQEAAGSQKSPICISDDERAHGGWASEEEGYEASEGELMEVSSRAATHIHVEDLTRSGSDGEGNRRDGLHGSRRGGAHSLPERLGEPRAAASSSGGPGPRVPERAASSFSTSGRRRRKPGGFRVQGKKFALTYPQCEVPRAEFHSKLIEMFTPEMLRTARESHKDGAHHIHVHIQFSQRKDVQSERYFDVEIGGKVYHPNIKKAHDVVGWLAYISKDGDYEDSMGEFNIDAVELGKKKQFYEDHHWAINMKARMNRKDIQWPVQLVSKDGREYRMQKPDPKEKKRSWWIVSPPNSGKSRWVNETFAGQKVYVTMTGPYPFEQYNDQDIVIYDDKDNISFAEFSSVLNTYQIETPRWGQSRYVPKYWKEGHTRNIIVLSNKTIEEQFEATPIDIKRMKSRFIQIKNVQLCTDNEESDSEEEETAAAAEQANYDAFAS